MKIIRRPMIAATVVIVADLLTLALAGVLNLVRGSIPANYRYVEDLVYIEITHPYDLFGIFTVAALVTAVVMTGCIIAAAITGAKAKTVSRIVGAAVLLVISVPLILFSHYFVCGIPARNFACFVFNDNEYTIAIQETEYSDGTGTVEVFRLNEYEHEHNGTAEHEHYSVEFLTASELFDFSTDSTRYELEWGYSNDLVIRFQDKGSYRSFHIRMEQVAE